MANETIIKAAGLAYAKETVDVSPQIEAMATISKLAVAYTKNASERTNRINKAFKGMDFSKVPGVHDHLLATRNNPDFTGTEKVEIFKNTANHLNIFEETLVQTENMFDPNSGPISGAVDSREKIWLSSVYLSASGKGDFFKKTHDIDLNNDGDTDDEGEGGLEPIKIIDYEVKVLNWDGEYVSMDDLPRNFIEYSTSKDLWTVYDSDKSPSKTEVKYSTDIDNYVRKRKNNFEEKLREDPKAATGFAYDRELETEDGTMTFVEYYLQNYISEEFETDAEGRIVDYDLLPEYQKIATDYNKMLDTLDPDEKEEFGRNIYRSIIEAEKDFRLSDELIIFYEKALRYELGTLNLNPQE